jgi:nitric oxide synthase oxygenase domain/subunit
MGWKPNYTDFEVLPLVVQANGQDPELFEIPADLTTSLEIIHPQ